MYRPRSSNRSRTSFPGHMRPNRNGRSRSAVLPTSYFIKKAIPQLDNFTPLEITTEFTSLPLLPEIQHALAQRNYKHPTPIQTQTIPAILEGKDIIGLANTGTGKTGAFLLPMLQKALKNSAERFLIMVPTRELGTQIQQELQLFSRGMKMYSALCIGGASIRPQIMDLRRDPQFVIGTPGRLKDLIQQRILKLGNTKTVVLDEADRMVDMGFIEDITYLLSLLPAERQSLFFSATLPQSVKPIINTFMINPVTVSVVKERTAENIDQDIVRVPMGENKYDVLDRMLKQVNFEKTIIFLRTKHGVDRLTEILYARGHKVVSIHGDKQQRARDKAIELFKNGRASILVATDVAARGIDIPDISHVINFDQPANYDDYIHRIGRTGRANKKGFAITFV